MMTEHTREMFNWLQRLYAVILQVILYAEEVEQVLKESNRARESANTIIDNLYATLDKEGDRWFLVSQKLLDDCQSEALQNSPLRKKDF